MGSRLSRAVSFTSRWAAIQGRMADKECRGQSHVLERSLCWQGSEWIGGDRDHQGALGARI